MTGSGESAQSCRSQSDMVMMLDSSLLISSANWLLACHDQLACQPPHPATNTELATFYSSLVTLGADDCDGDHDHRNHERRRRTGHNHPQRHLCENSHDSRSQRSMLSAQTVYMHSSSALLARVGLMRVSPPAN